MTVLLAPLPGSPEVVEALAASLRLQAQRLATAHLQLLDVRAGAVWDSPAGAAFAARVRCLPPVVDRVVQRCAGAARELLALAAVLRECQSACERASRAHTEAVAVRDRFGELMALAEASGSPAEQARAPAYRARMVRAAGEVEASLGEHARAWSRFREADGRCARALGALGRDGLHDPWHYDALTTARAVTGSIATNGGPLVAVPVPALKALAPAVAVAGVLELGVEAVLWGAYGDGSGRALAARAGAVVGVSAAGRVATWLKASARAGGVTSSLVAGPSSRLALGARLRAGAEDTLARSAMVSRLRGVKPTPPPPNIAPFVHRQALGPAGGGASLPVALRLREAARERVLRAFLDDWRVATRNGRQAQALLGGAWAVRAGATAYPHVGTLADQRGAERGAGEDSPAPRP